MRHRIFATLALTLLLSPLDVRADDKLAFLIPHLFGQTGLVVETYRSGERIAVRGAAKE